MKTISNCRGIKNLSIAERIKTVHWKFSDVSESYPQLYPFRNLRINSALDFYKAFKFLFQREVKEKFIVFWLNRANIIIGYEVAAIGTLTQTFVTPREVFRGAIVSSCNSIIIAHNHPSGVCDPSPGDIEVTNELIAAGEIIGIEIFDHIIFSDNIFCSLHLEGYLKRNKAN